MSVVELSQELDQHCRSVAESLIHLLSKGFIQPCDGSVEEAIADLRQQIASGKYN